jgi:hypothetical protein
MVLAGVVLLGTSLFLAGGTTAEAATTGTSPATVWLCRPGLADNPCTPSLSETTFTPTDHSLGVTHPRAAGHPRIDCFYVYPTVSDQKTANANLDIDPTERSIALYQAAQYSRVCRVYAPVYRQLTLDTINGTSTTAEQDLAYDSLQQAWSTYLHRYNDGRGVVLIGHSQGSFLLRQLISTDIDPKPAVRKLLVSAILLGGNVVVKDGSDEGGDFHHIPACHAATQTGCVIAWSTFDAVPPVDSVFGRTSVAGEHVLCTNPAALGGGSGLLDPVFPTAPFDPGSTIAAGIKILDYTFPAASTAWVSIPGAYRATCSSAGGANVLSITPVGHSPLMHPSPDATWGLHLVDANIALGNLVGIVAHQAAAYAAGR